MFNLPGGVLFFLLGAGLFAVKKRWLGWYTVCGVLLIAMYQWFFVPEGTFMMEFSGFQLQPYIFRKKAEIVGRFLAIFAFFFYVYLLPVRRERSFYLLSLFHLSAGLSLLSTNDLLSFFVFWEMLTVTAVLLILEEGKLEHVKKYLLFQMSGAVALLTGIGITYSGTGSLVLSAVAAEPVYSAYPFFLFALAVKTGAMPLHLWLVETYAGVSRRLALFLAATTTKVGAFGIVLLVPEVDLEVAGGLLAVCAVLYTFRQTRLRRFLSFHIIGRIGFIIAGVGSLNHTAVAGGLYQIVNSMVYMGLLFMVADVLISRDGHENFMRGFTRGLPLFYGAAVIAASSMAGLPPLNGHVGKALVAIGIESVLTGWLLDLASLLAGISLVRFIYLSFLAGDRCREENRRVGMTTKVSIGEGGEIFLSQRAAVVSLAGGCVLMGVMPGTFLGGLLPAEAVYYSPYQLLKGVVPVLFALAIFIYIYERIHPFVVRITPEEIGLAPIAAGAGRAGLNYLSGLHSGRLQEYLLWTFSLLGVLWIYIRFFS